MDISNNKYDFTEDTEPQDNHLIELLDKAYRGNILCRYALIDIEKIKPYSDYKPEAREYFKYNLVKRLRNGDPIPLYVYAQNDHFIMSDDYNSYYIYKEISEEQILCIVIGDTPDIDGVQYLDSPFKLSEPSYDVVDSDPTIQFSPDKTMSWEEIANTILSTSRTKAAYLTEDKDKGHPHSFLVNYPDISSDSETFLASTALKDIPKSVGEFGKLSIKQQNQLIRLFEDIALAGYILGDQNSPDSKHEVWDVILEHHISNASPKLNLRSLLKRVDVETALEEAYQSGWFETSRSRYEIAQVMKDLENES
jgi:hypothetical protein